MAEPIKLHPKRTQGPVAKETATGSCHGHAGHDHAEHTHDHGTGPASGAEHRVKDPVCGMDVDPHTATHRGEHQGRTYYFCSAGMPDEVRRESRALSRPEWPRRKPSPFPKAPSTPARCIPRSGRWGRVRAQSAAWRWSRCWSAAKLDRTTN